MEPVKSILAYPYGRFREAPSLEGARVLHGAGPLLRQWWRVAIAIEIASASQAAIAFTIDHVLQRHVFGRPVASFQSVQHRLVQCQAAMMATHYLALRAAWSGEAVHADFAACHALDSIRKLLFDLHQFNGGMGVTTEHMLHFWLYRIRALQAEAGGIYGAALSIADHLWSDDATSVAGAGKACVA